MLLFLLPWIFSAALAFMGILVFHAAVAFAVKVAIVAVSALLVLFVLVVALSLRSHRLLFRSSLLGVASAAPVPAIELLFRLLPLVTIFLLESSHELIIFAIDLGNVVVG